MKIRYFRFAGWGHSWELDFLCFGWELRFAKRQFALWHNYKPLFNWVNYA